MLADVIQIQVHLPGVSRGKVAVFEVDDNRGPQAAVEEDEIGR